MLFYYIRYVLEKQIGEGKMEKTMMKMMMKMKMVMIVNKYICTMRMYLNWIKIDLELTWDEVEMRSELTWNLVRIW